MSRIEPSPETIEASDIQIAASMETKFKCRSARKIGSLNFGKVWKGRIIAKTWHKTA